MLRAISRMRTTSKMRSATLKLCLGIAFTGIAFTTDAKAQPDAMPKATKEALLASLPKLTGLPALPAKHWFMVRAAQAADNLIAALEADGIDKLSDRDVWAWRGWVWAYHESGFQVDALGDNGASCGYLQVMTPEKVLTDATCDKVRKDGVLGFRVGLGLMKRLIDKCGSTRSGLTNYATGKECPTWTLPLVAKRMKLAGE